MSVGSNNLKNLTQGDRIGTIIFPKFAFPQLPEKIVKIDPEGLKKWQSETQRMFDEYNQKLQNAVNGNAS